MILQIKVHASISIGRVQSSTCISLLYAVAVVVNAFRFVALPSSAEHLQPSPHRLEPEEGRLLRTKLGKGQSLDSREAFPSHRQYFTLLGIKRRFPWGFSLTSPHNNSPKFRAGLVFNQKENPPRTQTYARARWALGLICRIRAGCGPSSFTGALASASLGQADAWTV